MLLTFSEELGEVEALWYPPPPCCVYRIDVWACWPRQEGWAGARVCASVQILAQPSGMRNRINTYCCKDDLPTLPFA